ncbi:hypothetical protein [Arthrobacter sp. UYCu723]
MKKYLTTAELHSALELRDLSDPAAGPHALQLLLDEVTGGLERLWHVETSTHRLSPSSRRPTTTTGWATPPTT